MDDFRLGRVLGTVTARGVVRDFPIAISMDGMLDQSYVRMYDAGLPEDDEWYEAHVDFMSGVSAGLTDVIYKEMMERSQYDATCKQIHEYIWKRQQARLVDVAHEVAVPIETVVEMAELLEEWGYVTLHEWGGGMGTLALITERGKMLVWPPPYSIDKEAEDGFAHK